MCTSIVYFHQGLHSEGCRLGHYNETFKRVCHIADTNQYVHSFEPVGANLHLRVLKTLDL